jgi:hypothetical protein
MPPTPITLTMQAPPLLVAYRDASAIEWKQAERLAPTTFQFFADGPYLLTVVCRVDYSAVHSSLWVQQIAQTLDDQTIPAWCEQDSGPNRLTGRSVQSANIFVHNTISDSSETSPFEFRLPAGTYDVVAETDDRIAVRRGIRVDGDTSIINPIDLMLEGASLAPIALTVSNPLPPESYAAVVILRSQFGSWWGSSTKLDKVMIVPNSVLVPTDVQSITLSAGSPLGGRRVRRRYREGDSTIFTLPERMAPVTFTRTGNMLTATWSTLPEHDLILHGADGVSTDPSLFVNYEASVSRSFEAATGITSATFDLAIPGYQPEWHIDLSKEYSQDLRVEHQVGNDTLISSRGISVNGPPMTAGDRWAERPDLFPGTRHWERP